MSSTSITSRRRLGSAGWLTLFKAMCRARSTRLVSCVAALMLTALFLGLGTRWYVAVGFGVVLAYPFAVASGLAVLGYTRPGATWWVLDDPKVGHAVMQLHPINNGATWNGVVLATVPGRKHLGDRLGEAVREAAGNAGVRIRLEAMPGLIESYRRRGFIVEKRTAAGTYIMWWPDLPPKDAGSSASTKTTPPPSQR